MHCPSLRIYQIAAVGTPFILILGCPILDADGPRFETILIFRVAAASRFPEGSKGLVLSLE
jgi:hypothetical protein